jgi:hypothetical protein
VPGEPETVSGSCPTGPTAFRLAASYWPALKMCVAVQAALLILLLLDGGALFRVSVLAVVGHWAAVALVVWRRPLAPTVCDLVFIRFGVFLLMGAVILLAPVLGRYRKLPTHQTGGLALKMVRASSPASSQLALGLKASVNRWWGTSRMNAADKKAREREILDLVYAPRRPTVADDERPDFLVSVSGPANAFGVEVAEFYTSESAARLKRIPDYVLDLLDGKDVRHKADRRRFSVEKFDVLDEHDNVTAAGIPGVLLRLPNLSECACMVAGIIGDKSRKLRHGRADLRHTNLIICDRSGLLRTHKRADFFPLYFLPKMRAALCESPFREVYFVTVIEEKRSFIPLNMLLLLSEAYFFDGLLVHRQDPALKSVAKMMGLFGAYLQATVAGEVKVRNEQDGTEVIYGDTGLLIAGDGPVAARMYMDSPFPAAASLVSREVADEAKARFDDAMAAFRASNTFVTELCFPIEDGVSCDGSTTTCTEVPS